MTSIRFIYVTTKDVEQARAIGRELLDRKLIACANILPQMESIYRWKGEIEHANESVLILKTEQRLVEAAIDAVTKLHSYDTPCALSFGIEAGARKYVDWLLGETK